jgi:hypothetical protein
MRNLLRALLPRKSPKSLRPTARQARPELEQLEHRLVPTVTYHGGALLSKVEVQPLFYGSDWSSPGYFSQAGYLSNYLYNIVNSSYMDMLTKAGYGVGRGSFDTGFIDPASINKSQFLSDGQLRNALVADIDAGDLKAPDPNRLYVIFVEDSVEVGSSSSNSVSNFRGYHGAFGSTIWPPSSYWPYYSDIHYAVIAYPGGSIPTLLGPEANASEWWLNTLDDTTLVTSHELAEAVTDPNVNYKTKGWYDNTLNGEVGDICVAQTVHLNGYAVQRISDVNDQAMTPAGAQSVTPVNFVLGTNGNLYLSDGNSLTFLTSGIASLSDQGIDNYGHAMVDVVTTGGAAYEYHEGPIGWVYLDSGVKMARASQGVSYVLYTNGTVKEYKDWGGWSGQLDSFVTSIDAGTDRYGVNMMTEVRSDPIFNYYSISWRPDGYEWSDSTGWHYLGANVEAVSAGQQGIMAILYNNANAYLYNEATGSSTWQGSHVAQITAGTDQYGNYMLDLVDSYGSLSEYRAGSGWTWLADGVQSIGKAHAGVVDVVFTLGGVADTHDTSGWHYLTNNALEAA